MATDTPLDLDAEAAEWIVQLTADTPTERARAQAGFDAWKRADVRHAAAAARFETLLGDVAATRQARPARRAVDAALAPKRRSIPRRAVGAVIVAAALAAAVAPPPDLLLADTSTGPHEWADRRLDDGSRIALDPGSAVDLHIDATRREVTLLRGSVRVDVAPDPARAFVVRTPHGAVTALGTRFVVRRHADATELTMLESRTRVRTAGTPPAEAVAAAGQHLRFDATSVSTAAAVDPVAVDAAWDRHQLVVHDQALTEVLDTLARHRRGWLHQDRTALAGVRVSAVLPLDDPDVALALLGESFPQLRVRAWGRWFVRVDTRSD